MKYVEEEIIRISYRFLDCSLLSLPHQKKELLILLSALTNLKMHFDKEKKKLLEKIKEEKNIEIKIRFLTKEVTNLGYCAGRVNLLGQLISSRLDKIKDVEKEIVFSEEDKNILKESKEEINKSDLDQDYIG